MCPRHFPQRQCQRTRRSPRPSSNPRQRRGFLQVCLRRTCCRRDGAPLHPGLFRKMRKISFLTKTYFQALLWHLSSTFEPGDLQGARQGEQRRSERSLPDSCRAEAVQEGGHQDGLRRHHPCGRPGTCSWTAGCHYWAGCLWLHMV